MKIDHHFIGSNGQTKLSFIARNDDGTIIDADTFSLSSARARKQVVKRLSEKSGIGIDAVEGEFLKLIDAPREDKSAKVEERPDHAALFEAMPEESRAGAEGILSSPDVLRTIYADIKGIGVAGERKLALTIYLVLLSRLLLKPASAIVQGPSSSGKSHVIDCVASLLPPEAVLRAQQLSPQALFHLPPGALEHRAVVAGERSRKEDDDVAEANRALREMISSGRLSKLMAGKDEHGRIVTEHIEQDGPIAYIESTTLTRIFDEDLNRCLLLSTDERPEQTERIIKAEAQRRGGDHHELDPIILRHHALQRFVAANVAEIVIPFAGRLAEEFPTERTEARRAFGHTLSMIEASALVHFQQRQRDEHGRIIAVAFDYAVARSLLATPMARSIGGGISDGAKRLWSRLTWPAGRFTSTEVYRREDFSDRACRGWLIELADGGFINVIEAKRGAATVYELVDGAPDPESVSQLPAIEDVCGCGVGASAVPAEVNA
jgi:hypothetical protein